MHLASARHHTSCREREGGNPRLTTRSSHHSRPFFSKTRNSRPGARAHLLVLPACTGVGGRCLRSADGPRGAITRAAQEHDQRAVAKVATARCLSSIQAHHEPFGWKDLPKPRSLAATGASRWQLLHLCKNRGSHAASRCQAGVVVRASGNCRRCAGTRGALAASPKPPRHNSERPSSTMRAMTHLALDVREHARRAVRLDSVRKLAKSGRDKALAATTATSELSFTLIGRMFDF